jgi:hypothetical protein
MTCICSLTSAPISTNAWPSCAQTRSDSGSSWRTMSRGSAGSSGLRPRFLRWWPATAVDSSSSISAGSVCAVGASASARHARSHESLHGCVRPELRGTRAHAGAACRNGEGFQCLLQEGRRQDPASCSMDHSAASFIYDRSGRLRLCKRYGLSVPGHRVGHPDLARILIENQALQARMRARLSRTAIRLPCAAGSMAARSLRHSGYPAPRWLRGLPFREPSGQVVSWPAH